MFVVSCYIVYLAISIAVTICVARTLRTNGRVFLVDTFHGNEAIADSVNHLLVAGFYLINIGWITLTLRTGVDIASTRQCIELLSDKLGAVLLVLGIMHFVNIYGFSRMRRRSVSMPPPLPAA